MPTFFISDDFSIDLTIIYPVFVTFFCFPVQQQILKYCFIIITIYLHHAFNRYAKKEKALKTIWYVNHKKFLRKVWWRLILIRWRIWDKMLWPSGHKKSFFDVQSNQSGQSALTLQKQHKLPRICGQNWALGSFLNIPPYKRMIGRLVSTLWWPSEKIYIST